MLKHIRSEAAKRLAERRPAWYDGLTGFNTKQHLRVLAEVDSYTTACDVKIWTGNRYDCCQKNDGGKGKC